MKKSTKKWIIFSPLILICFTVIIFVLWSLKHYKAADDAVLALKSDDNVSVTEDKYITFTPKVSTSTGFIFYPGAKVAAEAYSPICKGIAKEGYKVVIVPMPLHFAIFGKDKAAEVIAANPDIKHWAIGGHSLGGVMAANYAYTHTKDIDGLILYASYPQNSNDFSNTTIEALSTWGTEDGVAKINKIEAAKSLLPKDSEFKTITGGNHAQFGSYGFQNGDKIARISSAKQQEEAIKYTVELLKHISKK